MVVGEVISKELSSESTRTAHVHRGTLGLLIGKVVYVKLGL